MTATEPKSMSAEACDDPPPPREIVEAWLDRVRPALVADGGNVELVSIEHDSTVRIALQGNCADCLSWPRSASPLMSR